MKVVVTKVEMVDLVESQEAKRVCIAANHGFDLHLVLKLDIARVLFPHMRHHDPHCICTDLDELLWCFPFSFHQLGDHAPHLI